ncbi:hypothetical protein [Citrobacter freundii complex sp. CFNIH9]|uniref:hypothetical protein n=1 Tax=Citrobacter freundii complex sp. CFNIH9 TaxID=2077149 RepID=UPI000CCFFFC6|nr:hypothetical protein [Citrobacter freundii complex sp. CFNIH9]AUV42567.1 hypothetical protein C2U43_06645 [Citrobacter freundii complex sp. CFNIH9]
MNVIQKAVNRFLGTSNTLENVALIRMHEKKQTFFEAIIFPYIDLSDPMKATLFNKAISDMEYRFIGIYGRVDICTIRDIVGLAKIILTGESARAYRWLDKLHCVEFADMHPDIAMQVPHRINMVFSGGDYQYPWDKPLSSSGTVIELPADGEKL